MKSLLLFTLTLSTLALAEPRRQYSVTGTCGDINAFYHDILECRQAQADAADKAEDKCFREGFSSATSVSYGGCNSRLFGGKSVKATFYCI